MKNLGSIDKIIRYALAVILAVIAYMYADVLGLWLWAVVGAAAIMLGTALINFCPIYAIFGIKTCKID